MTLQQPPVSRRIKRKRTTCSQTVRLLKQVFALPAGMPVTAADLYSNEDGDSERKEIDGVLQKACDRGILKRLTANNYVRTSTEQTVTGVQKARIILTDDIVENAVRPASRDQFIYRDSKLIGFGLRLNRASKSFIAEARINGKCTRVTLGRADLFTVEEAREVARRMLRQMAKGEIPLTLRKKHKSLEII